MVRNHVRLLAVDLALASSERGRNSQSSRAQREGGDHDYDYYYNNNYDLCQGATSAPVFDTGVAGLGERTTANVSVVKDKIPGYKTSAAFLSSLRTNLRLHASPPPSPMSTPPPTRGSHPPLPPPSPLANATVPSSEPPDTPPLSAATPDPLAGVPELTSHPAASEEEKIAALKLVADSIAQQRQAASRALIFHPANLSAFVALLALTAQYLYTDTTSWPLILTTWAGLSMATLAGVRWLTAAYIFRAEDISWAWLGASSDVLVTKFGDEVIGALVLGWAGGEQRAGRRKKSWRGDVRAWTVRLRYRGKGVGRALLEDAVQE
ncbi:hypothetical protein LTR28_002228, partial [Elasticomyces elasticus]